MDQIVLRCPNCSADLNVKTDGSREYVFCEYCGTKIRLEDRNTTTYRYIDEARIREAELNARLKEKELELQSLKNDEYEKKTAFNRNFFRKRVFIYLAILVLSLAIGLSLINNTKVDICWVLASISGVILTYGSIGHAIALLVKRKRYR